MTRITVVSFEKIIITHLRFWFYKIVTSKDGKPELVDISKVVKKEKPHTCSVCKEKFGSPGALPTHVKCKHDTFDISAAKQSKVVKPCKANVDEEKVATTSLSRKKAASPEK